MRDTGFVYVVNTYNYLVEALDSIASLKKHMPAANITIICPKAIMKIELDYIEWMELQGQYDSPIIKTESLRANYRRCVFLDSDTRVIGDIGDLFSILDVFDIAGAHEPLRGWDYDIPAPKAFCEINTGVLSFKKTTAMHKFFMHWSQNYSIMRARQNLKNDQPAFRKTLWESSDIRHATLPAEFHLITGAGSAVAWDVRLLHGRNDLASIEASLQKDHEPRVYAPGWGVLPSPSSRKRRLAIFKSVAKSLFMGLRSPAAAQIRPAPVQWHL